MPAPPKDLIVALSGPLCAGKTTLARHLATELKLDLVSVRELLKQAADREDAPRDVLQTIGEAIEGQTRGRWIADAVVRRLAVGGRGLVIDAIRTRAQARALRKLLGDRVALVHLTASETERGRRFEERRPIEAPDRDTSFDAASTHAIERDADVVSVEADLTLDTTRLSHEATVATVLSWLDRRPLR